MPKTVLHIGMPRTGTTWLQNVLWPSNPYIELFVNPGWNMLPYIASASPTTAKARLISSEHITNWQGGMMRVSHDLRLLRDMFGDVPVMLTTRHYDDIMASVYRYYVEHGGAVTRKGFDGAFRADWGNWTTIYKEAREHFSTVEIFQYETLFGSQTMQITELKRMAEWLGVPPFDCTKENHIIWGPVNKGPRGWRFRALQLVNLIEGLVDMEKGINQTTRLRRLFLGTRSGD